MEGPHKFISNIPSDTYSVVIFCEYCGLIILYTNRDFDHLKENREKARKPCPNSPDKEALIP